MISPQRVASQRVYPSSLVDDKLFAEYGTISNNIDTGIFMPMTLYETLEAVTFHYVPWL